MANEITLTTLLQLTNGELSEEFRAAGVQFDQASAGLWKQAKNVGTSEESVTSFGDVATEGWCVLKNLEASGGNYVRWGFSTGVYGGRLEAAEPAVFRLNPTADLYLIADTAAVEVLILVLED